MTTRALLVEDEPIAMEHLRDMLVEHAWITVVGEARDGATALELVESLKPDVVFLDIEMPEMSGLDVLRKMRHDPAIVITTAKDRYAVAAFELEAVDYLLKPFGAERLRKAVERIRGQESLPAGSASRARDALEQVEAGVRPTRLFVRDRGKVVKISVAAIERLEAQDDYVAVHSGGRRYLVYLGMNDFEEKLDPAHFVRVHRSHIVNLDHVTSFTQHDAGRVEVLMRDGGKVLSSRARTKLLKGLLRRY